MSPTAEATTMSHKLTPARQNEILSHYNWTPEGKVRVQCTHRTEPLLRSAGVLKPQALEFYDVPVRRDRSGFLVLDHAAGTRCPQAAGAIDPLFAQGGLGYGLEGDPDETISPEQAAAACQGFAARLKATRHFELRISPTEKLHVFVTGYEDAAPPSPGETEQWVPARPQDDAIYAAARSLAMQRTLTQAEIHPAA